MKKFLAIALSIALAIGAVSAPGIISKAADKDGKVSKSAETVDLSEEDIPLLGEQGEVYRLLNPKNGDHLLTQNHKEIRAAIKEGWKNEGICFTVSDKDKKEPIYRLVNKKGGYHLFTCFETEAEDLILKGWEIEGIAFYASGNKFVYRVDSPNLDSFLYTTNYYEKNLATFADWEYKGIHWCVE